MHKPDGLLVLGFLQARDRFYWPRAPDHRLISKTGRVVIFDSVDKKKLCMLTFCILLNTCFLEMWLVKEENLLKVLLHPSIPHAILKFGSPLWIKDTLYMLDVRIDTVKIFTTNSTYHCEMHFGTTVAYRRVNLRCSTFASEVLHAVKIVVCFSPKETMMKHKAHQ